MAKHLSEDEVTLVVNAKADKAQQNIRKFSKEIDNLGERNKSLQRQMESLELAGKKNTDSWKQRREEYRRNSTQIRNLKQQIAAETKALDLNALTMAQLRQQARSLQRQLDNTSKTINPEDWKKLSSRLSDVRERMGELSDASKSFVEKYNNPQTMSFFRGELFIRFAELAGKALQKVKEFAAEGISMAETADGIIHAFQQLDNPNLLQTLRKATKNTVDDIELMKAAIKARDFGIPLEDLGKYLSFAQLKAQQLGVSVQQMTDDIVTGLGRKSPQILDNLGLSAAEISAKTKETGDFMKAVASIVENNLAQAGETYISAADRAAQKTAELHNRQLELGQALLPLKEKISNTFDTMRVSIMGCIVWLFQHRNASIALGFALTALTISMTALNTAFRTWIAQTTLAKVVMAGWTATTNTLKGIYLLVAAAINTMTGNTVRATAQMRLFNIACKSNVILLLVTALVAAGVAFYAYMNKTTEAQKALVDFNLAHAKVAAEIKKQNKDIEKQVNESTASEITKIKMLQSTIHNTSKSYAERKKAIQQMQSIVPSYHASITKEGRLFNENTAAIDTYIRNLRRAARAEAAYEKMKANEIKILNDMDTVNDARQKGRNVRGAAGGRGVNLNEGERVEARHEFVKAGANSMAKTYYVVVDKAGKVLREINEETAKLIMQDQQMDNMFDDRVKRAQDRINQYTKQNEFLEKIIHDNGGVGQKFTPKDLNHNPNAVTTPSKGGGSHSTKITPTKTDPDDKPINAFNNNRAEDIEEAKNAYQEDLNALNEALAMKKIKQEEYNAYISALNIQHQNNLLAIEKSYQEKANNLVIKDAAKKKAIKEQQNKAVADQQQAANNAYIEAEKQYYDALEKIEETAPAKPQTLQEECDAKLLVLDGYYKAALQRAIEDGGKQKEVTEAYEKAKAAIVADYAKKIEEEKARARQEYGIDTFTDQLAARRKKIDEDFAKGVLNKEQHQQAITNLEKQAEEQRLQIRQQYGLASQQELYNAENEQLKEHLRQGLITQEEYEEAVKNLKISRMKEAFDYYSNLAGGAVQALQQAEMANVDAKYDAEIEAARNAGKDTTELEKKKANEQLKIQKKYADINFAIKASQIVADTSVSIMKALGELGPIAGPIAAALMGITGAAQLAAANAERQKVKRMSLNGAGGASSASGTRVVTGLESGGSIDVEREQDGKRFHADYDPYRRGFIDKPTVIVGEGGYGRSREWVASNAAVENPTVAPFLNIIDQAQRAGNIRTLDMNKFLLHQAQGRAAGGYITPSAPTSQPMPTVINHRDEYNKELLETLKELRNNGIRSYVALDDFDAQQKLRNQVRRIASK
ncbi:MAG: 2-oxoacid:ferredoxin oxidoreductase subunit delta [Prevotella pallens]|uniref:2-oxoacid:ferredoxin oxidoreductase subunit delta n=2 Tax=Prevotella pallens TaxID=60133 RepID=UPI001CB29B3D|nr:2-oxoacid:ferredoxin oxidoreductase subunit delta [Prevotella pallens]MBF1509566.1 2-oxoacid:ferredoxin oxidoreductase subunit delta [Prevotella pallens]